MATMHPSTLWINTKSDAERILFKVFENHLPNDYVVIHSKGYIKKNSKGRAQKPGEIDFIILHPAKGILFVEAKSGRNFIGSGLKEPWYREDDGTSIRNPVDQVLESQYVLIDILEKQIPGFNLPHNIAVAFPQADTISGNLPAELLCSMIILRQDIKGIHSKIDAALRTYRPPIENPVSTEIFKKIVYLMRNPFGITTSLCAFLEDLNQQVFNLESEQVSVLDTFEQNRCVIVEGCTGSGKTLIALEKASRAALCDKRVLLLCFNIPLSEAIRNKAKERQIVADVFHFHGLAEHVIKSTGGSFPSELSDPNAFWDEGCAVLLEMAVTNFAKRYDCIIVDEAQDFFEDWWISIIKLLTDESTSELYTFLDSSQNIFCRKITNPFECMRISLNKNYRNTPAIVKWMNKVFGTKMVPSDRIDEGKPPVQILVKDDQSELLEINNIIDQLVNKKKLHPNQIIILGQHEIDKSIFRDVKRIGNYPIIEATLLSPNQDAIRYSSIYRFKGLEADCVILSGIGGKPREAIPENQNGVLLVGASRAKILLYVLHRNENLLINQ